MKKLLLFWFPRVLGLLYAAFLSLFAMDAASMRELALHLIPAGVIVALLALSFRWERLAGGLFILAGRGYVMIAGPRLDWIAVVSSPLFVVGILFLLNRRYSRRNV